MIFVLSRAFLDLTGEALQPYASAIENLITSHTQGWHIFAPGRELGDFIFDNLALSAAQAGVLRHYILRRNAELTGQARSVQRLAYCVPDGSDDLGIDERCLVVPLSAFGDMEACLKTELLVENARRDGALYTSLAEVAGPSRARLPLRFDIVNGGGNTTADELDRRSQSIRPLLAIVDSDRKSPGGAVGETMQRASAVMAKVEHPLKKLLSLEVRSLENFISLSAWRREVANDDVDAISTIDALRQVREQEADTGVPDDRSLLRYYSLKKGLRLAEYRKSDAQFRAQLRTYAGLRGCPEQFSEAPDPARDQDELLPPVGGRALDRLLSRIGREPDYPPLLLREATSSPCWEPLEKVLLEVIAFGIGGARIASAAGG